MRSASAIAARPASSAAGEPSVASKIVVSDGFIIRSLASTEPVVIAVLIHRCRSPSPSVLRSIRIPVGLTGLALSRYLRHGGRVP